MKFLPKFLVVVSLFLFPVFANAAVLVITTKRPVQGEPIMISVEAIPTEQSVQSISFDGKKLGVFIWKSQSTALYGIDLYKKPGTYKIRATLRGGEVLEKNMTIGEREKIEIPIDIPQKLGGNTQASADKLVDTVARENAGLLGLRTGDHAFWTQNFKYPLSNPIVTDNYGYQRQIVGYSIAHKGTDFRAKENTPVMAMNRGVVRVAREGRNYGKTIVLDHGLGLQTFYMHLSKINVNIGELVMPGQVIGLSGQTGYAEKPHLHLTVRINDVSIDPIKFLELFK